MPTNGLTEALQKWGVVSKKIADQWAAQTATFVGAADATAQAGAVRDGLALAVTSAVDVATTAMATFTLLVERPSADTSNWYETADGPAGRTLALEGDLVSDKDATKKIPVAAVAFDQTTIPAGKVRFTISCSTKDLAHDKYKGWVRVSDAGGTELQRIPVLLLV
jgi:hypothetical protein